MKTNQPTSKQNVTKRIRELREELEDLSDYLDLSEARAQNFGKKRYSTEKVKKALQLK